MGNPPHTNAISPGNALAAWTVRVVAAYILLGGLAKTFRGAPSDLPGVLLDAFPADPLGIFELAVAAEITVAVLAIIAPRLGWPFIAALMLGFIGVLAAQLRAGEASCGCFGSLASVSPLSMLVVDGVALALLLLVQPWRRLSRMGWRPWALVAAIAAAGGAVALIEQESRAGSAAPVVLSPAPAPAADVGPGANDAQAAAAPSEPGPAEAAPPSGETAPWSLPETFPRFVVLNPARWQGRSLDEINLARWVDTSRFPDDCVIVIYYDTCDHCAVHLRRLAAEPGDARYVLLQVPTPPNSTHPVRVDEMPEGLRVMLPVQVSKWQIRTPWEVHVERRVVTRAIKGF